MLYRELGRVAEVRATFTSAPRWDDVLDACIEAMEAVEGQPLLRKVRNDEPRVIGMSIVKQTGPIIDVVSSILAPALAELVPHGGEPRT